MSITLNANSPELLFYKLEMEYTRDRQNECLGQMARINGQSQALTDLDGVLAAYSKGTAKDGPDAEKAKKEINDAIKRAERQCDASGNLPEDTELKGKLESLRTTLNKHVNGIEMDDKDVQDLREMVKDMTKGLDAQQQDGGMVIQQIEGLQKMATEEATNLEQGKQQSAMGVLNNIKG